MNKTVIPMISKTKDYFQINYSHSLGKENEESFYYNALNQQLKKDIKIISNLFRKTF